jgi:hypothetical protein
MSSLASVESLPSNVLLVRDDQAQCRPASADEVLQQAPGAT